MDAETTFLLSTLGLNAPLDGDGLFDAPAGDAVEDFVKKAETGSALAKSGGWSWDDVIGSAVGSLEKRADEDDVLAKRRERLEWRRLELAEPIEIL